MKLDLREFYRLLVRPTVVISTISSNGISNAAPFSWNSPVATKPKPLFGFSCSESHDTWRNIENNGEFVVNLIGETFGPLMEIMERDFPHEMSEIKECGLTEVNSKQIKPPRIKEAFGWLECKMVKRFVISEGNIWIIGEVLEAEAIDAAVNGVVVVEKVKPLNHIFADAYVTDMKISRFKRA
jgi:flavin reductase (DIM6/NTAB) family NADH-FMN oxidoreductase RutF